MLFLKQLQTLLKKIQESIIVIINTIVLTVVYFVAVGSTAMIAKLVGKHFLLVREEKLPSYWLIKQNKKIPMNQWYRQF